MNGEIWFQLPPQSPFEWIIVGLTAFLAGSLLIFGMLTVAEQNDRFLSFRKKYRFEKVPLTIVAIGFALLLVIAALFFSAIAASFVVVFGIISPNIETPTPNLGGGALLTALIGGPFVIWRTMVAQWTVDHQRESLFNDKLNAASKDLAAWREVTRVVGEDENERVLTTREPDLVTRATAIDRLYGLIKERPSEASRIAAMLSLYVREHTVQVGDKIPDVPPVPVPENATPDELREWARGLQVGRSDLQKAVQAIGRIRDIPGVELEDNAIDLRGANLQAMNLSELNFGKGQWQGAQMQGVRLNSSQLQHADLTSANMHGAILGRVKLSHAKLLGAKMYGALLYHAELQNASLESAKLRGAHLAAAQLQQANLVHVDLQHTDLSGTQMQGASLVKANFCGAHLGGADLSGAQLNKASFVCADLNGIQIDENTELTGSTFQAASIRNFDFVQFPYFTEYARNCFGDGTNFAIPWPKNWPEETVELIESRQVWRTWVAQNHPNVLQYLPDRVRNA